MFKNLLLSSAMIVVAGSALAADLPARVAAPAPFVAPVFTWTGFYVGVNAGFAGDKFRYPFALAPGFGGEASINSSGLLAGAQVGYNWQFANGVVIGAEADYAFANIEGKVKLSAGGFGAEAGSKLEGLGTVRGRLGYGWDRTLFYVTGGWAYGRVKSSVNLGPYGASRSVTQNGWTVGAGVEYAFTNAISLKTEYLYVDLGKDTLATDIFAPGSSLSVDSRLHVLRAGVNYRF